MEGDFQAVDVAADTGISIHSLRMEGDTIDTQSRKIVLKFQSTPSVWRETWMPAVPLRSDYPISIHSLRMEGDTEEDGILASELDFNPLPPYGGRQQNCTGKRFSFRLSLYNPAKKDAKDYILHPKK